MSLPPEETNLPLRIYVPMAIFAIIAGCIGLPFTGFGGSILTFISSEKSKPDETIIPTSTIVAEVATSENQPTVSFLETQVALQETLIAQKEHLQSLDTPTDSTPSLTSTPQPTDTWTPTLIPQPTSTSTPTLTPIPPTQTSPPTSTSIPPTNTPVPPTNTPAPTPTAINDWINPHSEVKKQVEFKRCDQYPNYNFPEFDNNAGYIPLKPNSANVIDGQLAWCFLIRFTTPIDEWRQYVKGLEGSEPEGIAVYFQSMPPGSRVIVDNSSELGLPSQNGISIVSPKMIRVLLPVGTNQEPVVSTGPYPYGDHSYILD